jgi:hypothetical protein
MLRGRCVSRLGDVVTRIVSIDLDDPSDLERIWAALEARLAARRLDPETRTAIVRALEALEPERRAELEPEIRDAVEQVRPRVVMAAYWPQLIPSALLDQPALGHYLRPALSRAA